jgi:thiopeptide-type bacteriocin biosynthesis protein
MDSEAVERAVLGILTGSPIEPAACQAGIMPADLAAASRAYRQAGRAALAVRAELADTWDQVIVEFTNWDAAENTAAEVLVPRIHQAGITTSWWFLRKHPYWRIRYRPIEGLDGQMVRERIRTILDDMITIGLLRTWRPGLYEPETLAFGGPIGLNIAHELFCADSAGVLTTFGRAGTAFHDPGRPAGRKEISILLCLALMRGAQLDWFEQGDTWHRIARLRPTPAVAAADTHHDAIKILLATDTTPASLLLAPDGPLAAAATWTGAFRRAGEALATAASHSHLHRGLRDILAHLIIFHWNRIGLTANTQAILAHTLQDVIMNTTSRPA